MLRILTGFLCTCVLGMAQVDYFTPGNVNKFAEHLIEMGEYQAAATEYQRLSYLIGESPVSDSLLSKIAYCYQLDQKYEVAIKYYNRLLQYHPQSVLCGQTIHSIARIYRFEKQYEKSNNFIFSHRTDIKCDSLEKRIDLLAGMNYLNLFQWDNARKLFDRYTAEKDEETARLLYIAREGSRLPYKSATIAGILSTLIPGSGRFYLGRKMDGLYSFLLISLLGFQTYRSFDEQGISSVKGWLYGSVTAVLYGGNIYGTVVAAKIYNNKLKTDHVSKIEINLLW